MFGMHARKKNLQPAIRGHDCATETKAGERRGMSGHGGHTGRGEWNGTDYVYEGVYNHEVGD